MAELETLLEVDASNLLTIGDAGGVVTYDPHVPSGEKSGGSQAAHLRRRLCRDRDRKLIVTPRTWLGAGGGVNRPDNQVSLTDSNPLNFGVVDLCRNSCRGNRKSTNHQTQQYNYS